MSPFSFSFCPFFSFVFFHSLCFAYFLFAFFIVSFCFTLFFIRSLINYNSVVLLSCLSIKSKQSFIFVFFRLRRQSFFFYFYVHIYTELEFYSSCSSARWFIFLTSGTGHRPLALWKRNDRAKSLQYLLFMICYLTFQILYYCYMYND